MTEHFPAGFEHALQQALSWIDDVQEEARLLQREQAISALRAVLRALRDRLGQTHAIALGDQLPLLIRGYFYESWSPHAAQSRERKAEAFLEHVRHNLLPGIDPERATRAVLAVLTRRLDADEVAKIQNLFPRRLLDFWPQHAVTAPLPKL